MTPRTTLRLMRQAPKPRIPFSMLRRAVELFNSPYVPRSTRRHNARAWIEAVEMLGSNWVYKGGAAKWAYKERA